MNLKSLPLFAFGIMLIVMCIVIIGKLIRVLRNGTRTIAEIVDIKSYPGEHTTRYYTLQYRANGVMQRVVHDVGSGWIRRKDIGKKIKIIYDNEDPKKIIVNKDYSFYIMAIVVGIVGIWLVIEGIKLLLS